MRITYQDTKQGIMDLVPETLDDLWHISYIIEEGDVVSSKTTRRIQDTTGDKLRSDRGIKKTFFIEIKVESVSFHMFTGKLRATGAIVSGPEDLIPLSSHHTLEIKLNVSVKIKKEHWSRYILNRVKQAVEASKKLSAIIVSIEDDVADFGLVRQFGIEYYGPIIGNISGKRIIDKNRQKNIDEFYQKIVDSLNKFNDIQNIIIVGPGFTKNSFYDFLEDKYPNLSKIAILETAGTGGRVGIHEVLKRGVVEKLTAENRITKEIYALEEILEEISKTSKLVVYGKEKTINAANAGAIKKLLVLDKLVRIEKLEKVMDLVENMNGKVMVISSEHDGGKQLESLGGLAALLRYPLK
ncbi:Peptide chain release factor subunit 1 [Candidatus Methanobinarius endosymbioticus]|uniref:Protein pelota homolog n=1 Tax=Candidatus Methanobinarius endosymbioticus TaxID=2006182 RepID=A0A366MD57_9EURY|nr:Peptide chain release factor subunit 1 [Candidatus Methanobinarius endosymbioticus]